MLNRRTKTTRSAKSKTCLVLLGVLGVFGSSAYAVYAMDEAEDNPWMASPWITAKPAKRTWQTWARFVYTDGWHGVSFQCSLDRSQFSSCASPTRYPAPLAGGFHTFRVRALGWSGRRRVLSPPASYTWLVDLRPPAPYIARHPADPTSASKATFALTDGEPRVRFQCSITGAWRPCSSSVSYRRLSVGEHHFQVRAIDPPGRPSPVARFDWRVVTQASENFSISFNGIVGGLLYPGAAPEVISLTLANPNGVSIFVTSVIVTVPSGPAGCDSATNISLAQSNVSSAAPVEIQAHGSITLPAQSRTAPTIGLVNLPVNQDACQNARFPLSFTGSAHS
jgi:hypothetical protein